MNPNDNLRLVQVRVEDLLNRFQSKADLHRYMVEHLGYFLPSLRNTKMAFLKAILQGKKRVLKCGEVRIIPVPRYKELAMKQLINHAMQLEDVRDYLPEPSMSGNKKMPEKDFFFGVMCTIRHEEVLKLISESQLKRYSATSSSKQRNVIWVTEAWQEQLQSLPFYSRKKGRATYLLKERKFVKAPQTLKRRHDDPDVQNQQTSEQVEMGQEEEKDNEVPY